MLFRSPTIKERSPPPVSSERLQHHHLHRPPLSLGEAAPGGGLCLLHSPFIPAPCLRLSPPPHLYPHQAPKRKQWWTAPTFMPLAKGGQPPLAACCVGYCCSSSPTPTRSRRYHRRRARSRTLATRPARRSTRARTARHVVPTPEHESRTPAKSFGKLPVGWKPDLQRLHVRKLRI